MKKLLITLLMVVVTRGVFATVGDDNATSKLYVDTNVATRQDAVDANNTNTVMTYTDTAGTVGTKGIYDSTGSYAEQQNALVSADVANAAIMNAINMEFECAEWNPAFEEGVDCWKWRIHNTTPRPSGKNLFDKNNRTRITAWIPSNGGNWAFTPDGYSNRIPCKPNTTYTARYNGNGEQAILNFASTAYDDIPTKENWVVLTTNSIRLEHPTKNTPITITTGPNDKWLIVQYNVREPQNTDMAEHLQIEEGDTATAYEPYQNLYLPAGN